MPKKLSDGLAKDSQAETEVNCDRCGFGRCCSQLSCCSECCVLCSRTQRRRGGMMWAHTMSSALYHVIKAVISIVSHLVRQMGWFFCLTGVVYRAQRDPRLLGGMDGGGSWVSLGEDGVPRLTGHGGLVGLHCTLPNLSGSLQCVSGGQGVAVACHGRLAVLAVRLSHQAERPWEGESTLSSSRGPHGELGQPSLLGPKRSWGSQICWETAGSMRLLLVGSTVRPAMCHFLRPGLR